MKTRVLDNAISAGIGRGLLGVGDQRLRIVGNGAVSVSLGETVILSPNDRALGFIVLVCRQHGAMTREAHVGAALHGHSSCEAVEG